MKHPFLMFLDHTRRRSTVGRTPLDEWSARRRDLYLTTHDTHNRQISMPPVGFEPTMSAGERPQALYSWRTLLWSATSISLFFLAVPACVPIHFLNSVTNTIKISATYHSAEIFKMNTDACRCVRANGSCSWLCPSVLLMAREHTM